MKRILATAMVSAVLVGTAYGWNQVSPIPQGNPGAVNTGTVPFNTVQQAAVDSKASAHCFASDTAFSSCFGYRIGADGIGQTTTAATIIDLFAGDGQCLKSDGTRGDCGSGVTSYNQLSDRPAIPAALADLTTDTTHRLTTDAEKSTWNGKQAALGFTPGTAAAQNVGTGVGNIPQIGPGGKIPSGIYNAGLESQPDAAGQSIISSGAAAYDWLPNVPLTTNPSGLINSGGTLNLTGFQPLDPALTAAAGLDGSGANKMVGTNSEGTVGVINIPGKPTIQATPPTTSNAEGFYGDTAAGKFYYRSDAGIFELQVAAYTPDPTMKTLTIAPPANGSIVCTDQALSQSISCPGVCTASATTGAVIAGITAQADSGYTFGAFTGDIAGSAYNTGTVTLSADKTGSATFTSTALWAIDDPFTINTAGSYTRILGTTATLAVDTVNGNAYNSYTNSTGWFAHSTDLGSTNMVVQAVLTERKNSTTAGGSGVLINTDGVSIGYGVWVNAVNSRMTFTALGSVGTDVIKSFTSGAWVADASHLVQITRNGTTATIEIDFNDDGDFLDTNEQVGTSTLSALVNGTKSGIGFNWVQATDTVDNFRAKAL